MKIAPIAEVKSKLSAYIESSKQSPVIVTKNGKPVAFIAPLENEQDLDHWLDTYSQCKSVKYRNDQAQTLDEIVAAISILPPSQAIHHMRTGSAGQTFRTSAGAVIDLVAWDRQWAEIETEMQQDQFDSTEKTLREIKDALSH